MLDVIKAIAITAAIAILILFIMGIAYVLIPVTVALIVTGFTYFLVQDYLQSKEEEQ